MNILSVEAVDFEISDSGKGLTGTCKVNATYSDGVSISEDIGELFQMHAFVDENGNISSRADSMLAGDEMDAIWTAVSELSKATLAKVLV